MPNEPPSMLVCMCLSNCVLDVSVDGVLAEADSEPAPNEDENPRPAKRARGDGKSKLDDHGLVGRCRTPRLIDTVWHDLSLVFRCTGCACVVCHSRR